MLGKKKPHDSPDWRDEFRFGTFDRSGFISQMNTSNSKQTFLDLQIPKGTKAFLFPTESGFIPVYLQGESALSNKFSRGNNWLCAEKVYTNYEKSGSLSGKMDEFFHRVGDIKNSMNDEKFSLRANIFIVGLVFFAGVALAFSVASRLF